MRKLYWDSGRAKGGAETTRFLLRSVKRCSRKMSWREPVGLGVDDKAQCWLGAWNLRFLLFCIVFWFSINQFFPLINSSFSKCRLIGKTNPTNQNYVWRFFIYSNLNNLLEVITVELDFNDINEFFFFSKFC